MNKGVVVVGSVNLDLSLFVDRFPRPGETVLGGGFSTAVGGKGANQAQQAAAAGARTVFIGSVGRDKEATLARRALEAAGIVTILGESDEPTGRAWISVDETAENTIVVVPGANAALGPSAASALRKAAGAFADGAIVVCQGECPVATVDDVARVCVDSGYRFVLNLAPVITVATETLRTSDPLIVNEAEAQMLLERFDAKERIDDPAAMLHSLLEAPVVVTLGSRGAAVVDVDGVSTFVPAADSHDQILDSTGAGDALVGATVAALSGGAPLVDAVRAGAVAARKVLTVRGASSSNLAV